MPEQRKPPSLAEMVRDLLERFLPEDTPAGSVAGPGLMARLDDLALRTAQPRQAGGHAPPASRPPTSLDAVHWSVRIKTEARIFDQQLRRSVRTQSWQRAMKAIPPNAEAADRVREATSLVGTWHSTCRTVLGLQLPAVYFEGVACLVCGERMIHGRAEQRPRAWCTNPVCRDEATGRPARYEGTRLYLLTTNVGGGGR